jgi:multicomponent Na+:H+ antiporter subunit F
MQTVAIWLDGAVRVAVWGGLAALALSMLVACIVLIRAPEVADRAIAFDLTMVHVVGIIALAAIALNQFLLLDTLIVMSVLGFLGTVAIARYLERGLRGKA